MFVKVLPLDVSFDKEGLTYYLNETERSYLQVGSIVSIPIKNNISFGVVYAFEDKSEFENIKAIIGPVCSYPIIDEYEIEMIFSLSRRYFLPVHKVLNLFLPKFILNRFEKNSFQDVIGIDEIKDSLKETGKNVFYQNSNAFGAGEIFKSENLELEDSVLIFGDDFGVDYFMENNPEMKDKMLIYKNSLTYVKKYRLFLDTLSSKKNILIGTRKILQYNLGRYRNIYYFDDALVKYNYNQFEKFKNLDIIECLIKTNKFNVTFISSVPSVEMFFLTKKYSFVYKTI